MKVTIELDFENEPTRYEVYNYLLELMEDNMFVLWFGPQLKVQDQVKSII